MKPVFAVSLGTASEDQILVDNGKLVWLMRSGAEAVVLYKELDESEPIYVAHRLHQLGSEAADNFLQMGIMEHDGEKWVWGDFVETAVATVTAIEFADFYGKARAN